MATPVPVSKMNSSIPGSLPDGASLHNGQPESSMASQSTNIKIIASAELENLLLIARQHGNLRRSLLEAGISIRQIDLLSKDHTSHESTQGNGVRNYSYASDPEHATAAWHHIPPSAPSAEPRQMGDSENWTTTGGASQYGLHNHGAEAWSEMVEENSQAWPGGLEFPEALSGGGQPWPVQAWRAHPNQSQHSSPHTRVCKRTLVVGGLPDGTTYADLTDAIRGGKLLNIYLKEGTEWAYVSFLRDEDASGFLEYASSDGIYINRSRIKVRWADREHHMLKHVANQIAHGATRNLVIRRCNPHITEDEIRDDLEHIHNLVVIKVAFQGASCHIKTNSVHNAIYARTCMSSRKKFKGSSINWDDDECERPLETASQRDEVERVHDDAEASDRLPSQTRMNGQDSGKSKPKARSGQASKSQGSQVNRFSALRLDDEDNLSSDDERTVVSESTRA